jgi:hypothetical protein
MNCKLCRIGIEEAGADAPPGGAVGAHLADCAACRAFRAERLSLRALVAGLGRVDAPNDFEFRLRARLAAEAAPQGSSGWRAYFPRAAWAAVSVCLLIAVGVSLRPRQQTTPAVASFDSQTRPAAAAAGGNDGAAGDGRTRGNSPNLISPDAVEEVSAVAHVAATKPRVNYRRADKRARRQTFVPPAALEEIAAEVGGAESVESFAEHSRSVTGGMVIALPVSTEERPLQVTFKDMQGASRVVSVDPVAFGSREPNFNGARGVNAANKQGVW